MCEVREVEVKAWKNRIPPVTYRREKTRQVETFKLQKPVIRGRFTTKVTNGEIR